MAPEPILLIFCCCLSAFVPKECRLSPAVLNYCIAIHAQAPCSAVGTMAESQLNLELDTGLSGSATTDTEQNSPAAFEASRETSLYERYPVGQRKPYCLQLDASLVEVI